MGMVWVWSMGMMDKGYGIWWYGKNRVEYHLQMCIGDGFIFN